MVTRNAAEARKRECRGISVQTDSLTGLYWWRPAELLRSGGDAKTSKGESLGWTTYILYLAPSDLSGRQLCAMASKGCRFACLFTAGRGGMATTQLLRLNKTFYLYEDRDGFLAQLESELDALNLQARRGKRIAIRLNGTSDLPWHLWLDMARWESLVFYDYTKFANRLSHELAPNYSLTFSRSESNEAQALDVLRSGGNVAVVFGDELPETWHGFPLVQGDAHDLRFLDPKGGHVVGLTAKGSAKGDASGFVVMGDVGQAWARESERAGRTLPVLATAPVAGGRAA